MGVLHYFATLQSNKITKKSVIKGFKRKQNITHLYFDFNALIHQSSSQILEILNRTIQNIQNNDISLDYTNLSKNL